MRQHGYRIDRATARRNLRPRAEPYWQGLGPSRALGFRRSAFREGTWYARWTEPRESGALMRPKYWQKSLGSAFDIDYGQAIQLAQAYFEACAREWLLKENGLESPKIETVEEACRAYVESLRKRKGNEPADGADSMFDSVVYRHPIAAVRLSVLTKNHIETWRNGLVCEPKPHRRGRSKKRVNRIFRQFAAAMSYAKGEGAIDRDPWKQVGLFPVKDGRRTAYLTVTQRRALLEACEREKTPDELAEDRTELRYCTKDLADLLRGLYYTGARPGELAKARVSDLSIRDKRITFISAKNKKGEARPREFYLFEPDALEFFTRMAAGKSADEYLMTMGDGSPWVNGKGQPNRVRWSRGIRAAVRDANTRLNPEDRIQSDTVAYTARHTVITDLLSSDGIDQPAVQEVTGTSAEMIKRNYYKVVRERLQAKLAKRSSF